ncbi:hypothetical protein PAPYR_3153 [Paratrimastix pyriformis]|uniref:RING-type E3 ubiquitin transferase n=1 Tax=Paratrimastix pyriformis TaxID=342808 RepID=A0ABQ8USM3_9EUKA|nr:hypothetical protein PAPYR_3153 [Paratrimastix pyriformis]
MSRRLSNLPISELIRMPFDTMINEIDSVQTNHFSAAPSGMPIPFEFMMMPFANVPPFDEGGTAAAEVGGEDVWPIPVDQTYERLRELDERNVRVGLSDGEFSRAVREATREERARSSRESCSICQEAFGTQGDVVLLACKHLFHRGCIRRWFETAHLRVSYHSQIPAPDARRGAAGSTARTAPTPGRGQQGPGQRRGRS